MALSLVSVNWASLFANGILTATSTGTTWTNTARLADFFLARLAKTVIAPTGQTIIKVDQGTDTTKYLSANRVIIPSGHNIGTAFSGTGDIQFSSNDSTWTSVSNGGITSPASNTGILIVAFDLVTAGAGNRYWRFTFTKTDAAVEIGEVWLTRKIVLGQSETTAGEDGRPEAPAEFPLLPNIAELRTLEGVRSAIEQGAAMRSIMLSAKALTAASFLDWEGLTTGAVSGLRPFFIDDPRGATWFGAFTEIPRSLDNPERWDIALRVTEIP